MFIHKLKNATIYDKLYACGMLFLIFISLIVASFRSSSSFDIFFIIRTGCDILSKGSIPNVNEYVMNGNNFVVHQWLYDVVFAFITNICKHDQFGLCLFLILEIFVFLWIVFKYRSLYAERNFFDGLIIAFFAINIFVLNFRPELITLIILMLEIYCLSKYQLTHKAMFLYYLPIASILMVNFHAMLWPAIYAVLLAYLVPSVYNRFYVSNNIKINKHVVISVLLSIGCLFLNPYGYKVFLLILTALKISGSFKAVIVELFPLFKLGKIHSETLAFEIFSMFFITCATSVILLYFLFRPFKYEGTDDDRANQKLNSATVYMCLGFILMAIMHARNVMFVFIALIMLLTNCAGFFKDRAYLTSYKDKPVSDTCKFVYKCSIVALFFTFCVVIGSYVRFLHWDSYPDYLDGRYDNSIDTLINDPKYDDSSSKYVTFNYVSYCEYLGMHNLYADVRMEYSDLEDHNMCTFSRASIGLIKFPYDEINKNNMPDPLFNTFNEFLSHYDFEYLILSIQSDHDLVEYVYKYRNDYELYNFDLEDFSTKLNAGDFSDYTVIFKKVH